MSEYEQWFGAKSPFCLLEDLRLGSRSFFISKVSMLTFNQRTGVTNAATAAASKVTGVPEEDLKDPNVFQQLWSGLLDDVIGGKKLAKA